MNANQFLEGFYNRSIMVDVRGEGPEFMSDAEFVGEWLNTECDCVPFGDNDFAHYIIEINDDNWSYMFCKKERGYCPACGGGFPGIEPDTVFVTLHELRAIIEDEAASGDDLGSMIDQVFM